MDINNAKIKFVLGFFLIVASIGMFIRGREINQVVGDASKWPFVQGKIEIFNVSRVAIPSKKSNFKCNVVYSYTVNDKLYTSDTISFDEPDATAMYNVKKKWEKYSEGSTVKVYYNPKKPYESALEPMNGNPSTTYYAICFILSLAGIFFIVNCFTGFGDSMISFLDRG